VLKKRVAFASACAPLLFNIYGFAVTAGCVGPAVLDKRLYEGLSNLVGLKISYATSDPFDGHLRDSMDVVGSQPLIDRGPCGVGVEATSGLAFLFPDLVLPLVANRLQSDPVRFARPSRSTIPCRFEGRARSAWAAIGGVGRALRGIDDAAGMELVGAFDIPDDPVAHHTARSGL
jgi:hypothetical protein